MRSSVTSNVVLVGLVAGLALTYGCTVSDPGTDDPFTPTAGTGGASVGTSGSSSMSGATGTTAGSTGVAGSAVGGGTGMAGSAAGGNTTTAGAGGQSSMAGASGSGGGDDVTKVVKSMGCGKAFTGTSGAKVTIQTSGTKDADCAAKLQNGTKVCGPWQAARDYYVFLPANYDMNKPYNLIFEGPGCGGNGTDIYPYNNSVDNTAIRVGLTPGPVSLGHGTNAGQGCFDDKEGDDSIDWVFYENMYDKLNQEICFDRSRVFAGGNSSGAWFSNELGCKYAGDAARPVRGIMPNTGGLPTEAAYVPTCTNKGMAGMWIHETGDTTNGFAGNIVAIDRAMKVNKCAQQNYASAMFDDFPIGGGQGAGVCKRIKNCDPLYPLVVCPLSGNGHGSHDEVVNPGVSTFIKLFSAPPLAGQ